MSFWDTILGNELAKTLIQELPKLNEHKEEQDKQFHDLMSEINALRKEVEELKYIVDERVK